MIIHGSPLSPFRRKVVLTAMEKNIVFEGRDLNPYAPPEDFETMNPLRRIPIVQDGDFTLADSSAICGYFEAKYGNSQPLYPKIPTALGRALWIEEYADTALFTVISEGVFRPIFINQLLGKPIDHATIERTLKEDLPIRLQYLETQLEERTWFADDSLTIADIAVYAQLVSLQHAEHLPSPDAYPQLMGHFKRVQARSTAQALHSYESDYLRQSLKALAG